MMKKIFFIAMLAISVGLVSCKKDYNCTCTYPASVGIDPETIPIPNSSKDDAETICDTYNAGASILGGSCSVD
jgi:hypothetical protein